MWFLDVTVIEFRVMGREAISTVEPQTESWTYLLHPEYRDGGHVYGGVLIRWREWLLYDTTDAWVQSTGMMDDYMMTMSHVSGWSPWVL